jgi:hypothetical protein
MADPVKTRVNTYSPNYDSSEARSSEDRADSPSTPRMTQGKNSSSASSVSAYPRDLRNIEHDINEGIAHTRKLNAEKEELWAKFSEKTEVNVVTKLDSLSSSDIGELSKWLREKAHPQINVLSISKSDIDDKGAKALAKAIKPKSTLDKLTTLKLGHKLSKLATLELVGNTISDEGFKTLAKAIQNNLTITMLKIDLEGSTNSDQGIITLTKAISTNRTITKLLIRVTKKYDDKDAKAQVVNALAEMVRTTQTLQEIEFIGFSLVAEERKPIDDAEKANPTKVIKDITSNNRY